MTNEQIIIDSYSDKSQTGLSWADFNPEYDQYYPWQLSS